VRTVFDSRARDARSAQRTLQNCAIFKASVHLKEVYPVTTLDRTKDNPWRLKTPPGSAEYTMHVEEKGGTKVLVCTVGKTVLEYDARCVDDLHAMLKAAVDRPDRRQAEAARAASHPEAGDFAAAVRWQEKAVASYPSGSPDSTGARARLVLFKDSKPYRE
jgi:hypothetical protein